MVIASLTPPSIERPLRRSDPRQTRQKTLESEHYRGFREDRKLYDTPSMRQMTIRSDFYRDDRDVIKRREISRASAMTVNYMVYQRRRGYIAPDLVQYRSTLRARKA